MKNNLLIAPAKAEELAAIDEAITDYNIEAARELPRAVLRRLDFVARDAEGSILGGIQAKAVNWGILHIELLFVFEKWRKAGLGEALLTYVEDSARRLGCHLAHLSTFDFQGKDFYLKNGYVAFGVLEECPKGHSRVYLKKDLS